jgi:hypothetical protein
MQLLLALFLLICWFIIFGFICYSHGLDDRNHRYWFQLPFIGLKQDLLWIFDRPKAYRNNLGGEEPGFMHYIIVHGMGLILPIYMIIDFVKGLVL